MNFGKKAIVANFIIYLVLVGVIFLFVALSFFFINEAEDEKKDAYLYHVHMIDMSLFSRNVLQIKVDSGSFSDKIRLYAESNDCNAFRTLSSRLMSDLDDEWFTYFAFVKEGSLESSCISYNYMETYNFQDINVKRLADSSIAPNEKPLQAFRPVIIPSSDQGLIYFVAYDSRLKYFADENAAFTLKNIFDSQVSRGFIS